MKIREYEPKDCNLLAKLFYDTIHVINARDYTQEQCNAWATGNVDLGKWNSSFLAHTTLVAVMDNNHIAGFADMDQSGYLDKLFVHKDYQGIGIASALVSELERRVGRSGVFCFETYASITARPFFEKLGYVVGTENTVVREGISLTNFKMSKKI